MWHANQIDFAHFEGSALPLAWFRALLLMNLMLVGGFHSSLSIAAKSTAGASRWIVLARSCRFWASAKPRHRAIVILISASVTIDEEQRYP